MDGGGNEDSISILTDGTYNEERNKKRNDELNKYKVIYYTQNIIDQRKFIEDNDGVHEVKRPLNAPCETDFLRMGGRERFFIKGPDGTPLVEHCLYNAFLFGISNTPNLIGADADGNRYYERIVTNQITKEPLEGYAVVLKVLLNICDRNNANNMFLNKNGKLINLDTENINGKFIFDNSSLNDDFNVFKEKLQEKTGQNRRKIERQLDSILKEKDKFKKYDYETFLKRYISTCNKCYINMEKARHELHAFVKSAKKYKEALIARLTEEIKNLENPKQQNNQNNNNKFVKGVFEKILQYSRQDLENFNAFLKEHNSFKEQLGNYKGPGFLQRVYNFMFGNFYVDPVKPLKTLVRYSGKDINHRQSNQK